MAFNPETSLTPVSVGDIAIILTDYTDQPDGAQFEIQVLQGDGELFRLATGDLGPHLTETQKSALTSFLADMRTKAEAELLPGG
jgi:hypothetical protein